MSYLNFENATSQGIKAASKKPFGAHFTTKLSGVNDKLVCALSQRNGPVSLSPCYDYTMPDDGWDFNGSWDC